MKSFEITLKNQGTINKNVVSLGSLRLYFSYETIIAFSTPATGLVCSENDWSTTTGKFLNEIQPAKELRTPYGKFCEQLDAILSKIEATL